MNQLPHLNVSKPTYTNDFQLIINARNITAFSFIVGKTTRNTMRKTITFLLALVDESKLQLIKNRDSVGFGLIVNCIYQITV